MNEQPTNRAEDESPNDILQQAVESIESEPIPPGPSSELIAVTIRALDGFAEPLNSPLPFVPRTRIMKFAAIAASLLLVTGLLTWFVPTVESPHAFGEEFGRALKQVRESRSMSYVQEMKIEGHKKPIITKDFIAEDGRKRSEQGNITHIFDTTGQIRLTLIDPPSTGASVEVKSTIAKLGELLGAPPELGNAPVSRLRTAIVGETKEDRGINAGKMFLNWLERLKDLGDRPDKELGRKELDGKKVTGFVATEGERTFTMWVDSATGEPVRIEYDSLVNGAAAHTTMKDFHFHQTLDDSLFSFEVPAGYEIFGRPKDGKIEPAAGLEVAWSRKGKWSDVASAIGRPTVYGLEPLGRLSEWNAADEQVAKFKVGEYAAAIRTAKLAAGEECQLLTFRHPLQHGVEAYSTDGNLLWSYTNQAADGGILDVWPADLDGDGLDEVIIGYGGAGGVHVLDPKGYLLWKNTDRGNIWHVAAGDVDGDGRPEVLTTSADGKVYVFNAEGKYLRSIDPGFYTNLVRIWQATEKKPLSREQERDPRKTACRIIVAGGGTGKVTLALLNFLGETQWSLEISAPVTNAAISSQRPWLAMSLQDGTVRVVDLAAGKEIAHLGGQGAGAGVAWLPGDDGAPLLVITANHKLLQSYRIAAEQPK